MVARCPVQSVGGNNKAEALAKSVSNFRVKLETLRNSYFNYVDVAEALKEAAISGGRPQVPGSIFDRLLRSIDGFAQQVRSDDHSSKSLTSIGALKRD